jgi:hypothetical protein
MSGGIIMIESKIVFTNSVLFPGRQFVFGIEDGNYNYIIMCDNGSKFRFPKNDPRFKWNKVATEEEKSSIVQPNKSVFCRKLKSQCGTNHDRVYFYLENSPQGLTADGAIELMEIEDGDGIPKVNLVAPVLTEFCTWGIVKRIGTRSTRMGKSAQICILTEDAQERFKLAYGREARIGE